MRYTFILISLTAVSLLNLIETPKSFADESSICFSAMNKAKSLMGEASPTRAEKQPPFLQITSEQYKLLVKLIRSVHKGDSKESLTSRLNLHFEENPIQAKGIKTPIRGYTIKIYTHREDENLSNVFFDKFISFVFDTTWRLACIESNDSNLNPGQQDDLLTKSE